MIVFVPVIRHITSDQRDAVGEKEHSLVTVQETIVGLGVFFKGQMWFLLSIWIPFLDNANIVKGGELRKKIGIYEYSFLNIDIYPFFINIQIGLRRA